MNQTFGIKVVRKKGEDHKNYTVIACQNNQGVTNEVFFIVFLIGSTPGKPQVSWVSKLQWVFGIL